MEGPQRVKSNKTTTAGAEADTTGESQRQQSVKLGTGNDALAHLCEINPRFGNHQGPWVLNTKLDHRPNRLSPYKPLFTLL